MGTLKQLISPVLFDTNIVIDHLNGVQQATALLRESRGAAISMITWMEVMVGTKREDEADVRALLERFVMLPLSRNVCEEAVIVRKRYGIKLPDALIRAAARVHGRVLVTRNTRDFPLSGPDIHIPYTL